MDKKPGDIIRVSGKNFDLVKKVQMPNGDEVEFTMTASSEGDELTFTLPDNVSDGEVTVLPASDVKVVVATVVVSYAFERSGCSCYKLAWWRYNYPERCQYGFGD